MDGEKLERTLGRIEQKIDDTREAIDRMRQGLYGEAGIEPRLREIESDIKVIKATSALISGAVSTVIAASVGWLFKR